MKKNGMKQYPGFANTFLNKTCIYEVDPSVFDEQPAPVDFLRVKSSNNIFFWAIYVVANPLIMKGTMTNKRIDLEEISVECRSLLPFGFPVNNDGSGAEKARSYPGFL